jgi:alpha-tubulin suppressor-like RCC1 family protein
LCNIKNISKNNHLNYFIMKKAIYSVVCLISMQSFAQVGINTTTPEGILDVVNPTGKEQGLVLPRVSTAEASTTPANAEAVAATILYDKDKECVRMKTGAGWSDCLVDRAAAKAIVKTTLGGQDFWYRDEDFKGIPSYMQNNVGTCLGDATFFANPVENGALYGVGNDGWYPLGTNSPVTNSKRVFRNKTISVIPGYNSALVLDSQQRLWVSGRNDYYQLGTQGTSGNNSSVQAFKEIVIPGLAAGEKIIQMATVHVFGSAVLTSLGNVYTCGYFLASGLNNSITVLNTGDANFYPYTKTWTKNPYLSNIKSIWGGDIINDSGMFTAIDNSGSVFTWGRHFYSGLNMTAGSHSGFGPDCYVYKPFDITAQLTPFIPAGDKIKKIKIGGYRMLAITEGGKIIGSGGGSQHAIGDGYNYTGVNTVKNLTNSFGTMSAGETLLDFDAENIGGVVISNKRVWVAGDDTNGRLGNGIATGSIGVWTETDTSAIPVVFDFEHVQMGTHRTLLSTSTDPAKGSGKIFGAGYSGNSTLGHTPSNYKWTFEACKYPPF